jgi:hypothetical protein
VYWKLATLNGELRDLLVGISRHGRLEGTPCFFVGRDRRRMLMLLAAAGTVLAPVLMWWCASVEEPAWARLGLAVVACLLGAWSISLWLEFGKACRSELQPCILVTPKELLRVGYDHGDLEGYKLRDADDFKAQRNFSKVNPKVYTGTEYIFRFNVSGKPEIEHETFSFTLVHQNEIDALDAVLTLARDSNSLSGVVELLPNQGGSQMAFTLDPRTLYGWITNPFGIFWLCLGVVLLLGFLGGACVLVVLRLLGKF